MKYGPKFCAGNRPGAWGGAVVLLAGTLTLLAVDWPQYRGPATDGISPDRILKQWPSNGPPVLWRKPLANGFSSFAISQGRAFTLVSRGPVGQLREVCLGLNADTGAELWATPIGQASYPEGGTGLGSEDGPRTTPSVRNGRVFALSAYLALVCLNATNGSVIWSNHLNAAYGGSVIPWQNAASPRFDEDLIFVNCNTTNLTLLAIRADDGSLAWRVENEQMTHSTPVLATIDGVRQVIFATQSGLVSLDRTNQGALLWKHPYPFTYGTSMGASPVVHSNIVFCGMSYNGGSTAARVTLSNETWTTTQLWFQRLLKCHWTTPVCHEGFLYGLFDAPAGGGINAATLKCLDLATGQERWSAPNFGQGGIILVDNTLLVQTSTGHLVLAQPTPAAYTELARFRSLTGASWNSPAVADGRLFARSTREGIALNIAPPPPLQFLPPQWVSGGGLDLAVGTATGGPLDTSRLDRIEVWASTNLAPYPTNWTRLTGQLTPGTNGVARWTNTLNYSAPHQYFMTIEPP